MPRKERRKKHKKTLHDAASTLDDICYDLEEIYECYTIEPSDTREMVMEMSPQDHIELFDSMQDYVQRIRIEVEFILQRFDEPQPSETADRDSDS